MLGLEPGSCSGLHLGVGENAGEGVGFWVWVV